MESDKLGKALLNLRLFVKLQHEYGVNMKMIDTLIQNFMYLFLELHRRNKWNPI